MLKPKSPYPLSAILFMSVHVALMIYSFWNFTIETLQGNMQMSALWFTLAMMNLYFFCIAAFTLQKN